MSSAVLNLDEFQAHSRTRTLPLADLLDQLPALQKLLLRLIYCQVWRIRNSSTKLENKKLYQASGCNSLILACHFIFHHHFAAWRCSLCKLPCTVCASPCESETRSDSFLVKNSVHFLIVLSLTEVLWALGFEGKFQNILFNQWRHHQSCWYGTVRCLFHVFICPSSEHKLHTLSLMWCSILICQNMMRSRLLKSINELASRYRNYAVYHLL